jgi:hypothetical protein
VNCSIDMPIRNIVGISTARCGASPSASSGGASNRTSATPNSSARLGSHRAANTPPTTAPAVWHARTTPHAARPNESSAIAGPSTCWPPTSAALTIMNWSTTSQTQLRETNSVQPSRNSAIGCARGRGAGFVPSDTRT